MPGSGKTTWAKEAVEYSDGKLKLVSKDSIREMLDNGKGFPDDWETVESVRDRIAVYLLSRGFDVIFDETHLPDGQIQRTEDQYGSLAKIKYIVFDVDFYTCFNRVTKREDDRRRLSYGEMLPYYSLMEEMKDVLAWRSRNQGVSVAYGARPRYSEGARPMREGNDSGRDLGSPDPERPIAS